MPPDDSVDPPAAYDRLAATYETREADPYCADLEFPAVQDLLPDVAGRRILDAGCGRGRYTEWLLDEGAEVVAVDASRKMVAEARDRVGGRATVRRADLAAPLSFADDGEFDGVVSGLTLHYLDDWRPVFAEFARVLAPGGFLAFSTHHPLDDYLVFDDVTYFDIERESMTWSAGDETVAVPFYRRPFGEVIRPLVETGFGLDDLVEPTPRPSFEAKKPESYEKRLRQPTFLCVLASLPARTGEETPRTDTD